LDDIEEGALIQARNLANLPFVFKWVAIMPDCHQGYGMPIGGVLATKRAIIPNAVGVDIGCGMCAIKTSLKSIEKESLKKIMGKIRRKIPMGFNHHKKRQLWSGFDEAPEVDIVTQELNSAEYQLGTLGGGNHFIEIQSGSDGYIWIMLHSGSRNFGLKIANEYHKKAKILCEKWFSELPNKDLSFLPTDTQEANEYINAMNYVLQFAKANRYHMIDVIKHSMAKVINNISFDKAIDVHHNYAVLEHHFGENVIVHRKGAISARKDQIGIIPGSQGTKSYIVSGKSNPESFMSCSHGAGRKMSRNQAKEELSLANEKDLLNQQNIIHSVRHKSDLDEAPGAYKDIQKVMQNQSDLINIVIELSPLGVIKG